MDTDRIVINKETLIPLSVAGLVFMAAIGCMVWMSTVYAKVDTAKTEAIIIKERVTELEKEQKRQVDQYIEIKVQLGELKGLLTNKSSK